MGWRCQIWMVKNNKKYMIIILKTLDSYSSELESWALGLVSYEIWGKLLNFQVSIFSSRKEGWKCSLHSAVRTIKINNIFRVLVVMCSANMFYCFLRWARSLGFTVWALSNDGKEVGTGWLFQSLHLKVNMNSFHVGS